MKSVVVMATVLFMGVQDWCVVLPQNPEECQLVRIFAENKDYVIVPTGTLKDHVLTVDPSRRWVPVMGRAWYGPLKDRVELQFRNGEWREPDEDSCGIPTSSLISHTTTSLEQS